LPDRLTAFCDPLILNSIGSRPFFWLVVELILAHQQRLTDELFDLESFGPAAIHDVISAGRRLSR